MENRVELAINSTANTVSQGFLDLYGNEPINIKMSIADIRDISKRSSPYAQTFTLPGTKNNNELLSHIFQIGEDSTFDARKRTPSYLTADSIPVMPNGVFQLTGIVKNENDKIDYQGGIFSESQDLFSNIGDNELTNLDFSELNHVYTYSSITTSWSANSSNAYFYPLIDYGWDFNISDMQSTGVLVSQMLPAIQTKYVLDKIFSAAGLSYGSNFLSGSYFTNLYHPYNGNGQLVQSSGFTNSRRFQAQCTVNTGKTISLPVGVGVYGTFVPMDLAFTNDSTTPNFDAGGLYSTSTHKYSSDTYSNQIFNVTLQYEFVSTGATNVTTARNFVYYYRSSYLSGTVQYSQASDWPGTYGSASGTNIQTRTYSSEQLNGATGTRLQPAQPGETFWARVFFNFNYNSYIVGSCIYNIYSAGTFFSNTVLNDAIIGQTFDYNQFIPKKIKQKDFFNSLIAMHNLYVVPDKVNSKKLIIEPRDVYYSGGTNRNWTSKVDLKMPINEKLISEQTSKRFIFTYKADKDWFNVNYTTSTNKIFGDEYFTVDNEFITGDKKTEVIFSPTPCVAILQSSISNSVLANEFVVPKIGIMNGGVFTRAESNIRILSRHSSKVLPLNLGDEWKLNGITQTKYPYLGMLNHPATGTTDLAFGEVGFVYYTLSSITENNLVNIYWRTYLEQIADKDSRLITCNIYLTPQDINSFSFADSIFIDGLTQEGGNWFIVNSIAYSPTDNASSKVELIKVKNKYVAKINNRRNTISLPINNALNTMVLGGNGNSQSPGVIILGSDISVAGGSNGSFASGKNLTINQGSNASFVMGDTINIGANSARAFIVGTGVTIGNNSQSAYIVGNDNTVANNIVKAYVVGSNNNITTSR